MDHMELSALMGGSVSPARYQELLPHFLEASRAAEINNDRRMAMWVAQLGHESQGLLYMEEIADGSAYEGMRGLGNTQPGDGRRFKGRGPIQLTGRTNYRAFTKWANSIGVIADFEANPTLVSNPRYGFLAAAYYWVVARPQLNAMADRGDMIGCTRAINGGLNGLTDRENRYRRALKILGEKVEVKMEKVLDYPRDQVAQDTVYNCGPASVQTIVRSATGILHNEKLLGAKLGTHTGGTDYIGQFPRVLNELVPGGGYRHRDVPAYLDPAGVQRVWDDIVRSIDANRGVVVNIVAPPSNYPRAVAPSTTHPAYRGGTIYHYIAVMGYGEDTRGRRVWVADSGFSPYGYWLSLDQLCTLIVPKGYAYHVPAAPTTPAVTATTTEEDFMSALSHDEQRELLEGIRDIRTQLRGPGMAGWEQLGQNDKGQNLTLVDGIAAVRRDIQTVKGNTTNV